MFENILLGLSIGVVHGVVWKDPSLIVPVSILGYLFCCAADIMSELKEIKRRL